MDDNSDPNSSDDWLRNLPLRSEKIGFAPDEMVVCRRCTKANAPNRPTCLYCGAELAGVSAGKKLDLRKLEIWENGFNVVVTDSTSLADADHAAMSLNSLLGVEPAILKPILNSRTPIPVARVESEEHAAFLSEKLAEVRIETRLVSDASLLPSSPPVRLRAVLFGENELELKLFNSGDLVHLRRDDLALIVTGILFEARTESFEQRKLRSTKTVDETETVFDTPVIDIYSRQDSAGWRISSYGFDFSCLGKEKSLLAAENMERLIAKLGEFSPAAKLVGDFADERAMLEHCWPSESRKDAYGFQRSGFARKDLSKVSSTNNAVQLVKYSRLQWHLL